MTTDRLDRIDLLLHRLRARPLAGDPELREILEIVSDELRYLHLRPAHQQLADSCGLGEN